MTTINKHCVFFFCHANYASWRFINIEGILSITFLIFKNSLTLFCHFSLLSWTIARTLIAFCTKKFFLTLTTYHFWRILCNFLIFVNFLTIRTFQIKPLFMASLITTKLISITSPCLILPVRLFHRNLFTTRTKNILKILSAKLTLTLIKFKKIKIFLSIARLLDFAIRTLNKNKINFSILFYAILAINYISHT